MPLPSLYVAKPPCLWFLPGVLCELSSSPWCCRFALSFIPHYPGYHSLYLQSYFFNCGIPVRTQLFLPLVVVLTMEMIKLRAWERDRMHFKRLPSVNNPSTVLAHS